MYRKNIYDKDHLYSFLKWFWVGGPVRHSYRKVEVHGKENLPKDGAVLIAPNHCNTLMDALVILRAFNSPTVFGARADMFRKPLFAKAMYFFRILPMVRQRDGLRNVLQNNQTQEIIVETLENNVRFCLFPEGKHRAKHSLQTLGKGLSRIAVSANDKFGAEKPIYIVPTGIEYGDYFRYRSTSLVTFGEAVNITEFLKNNSFDNEAQALDAIRKLVSERIPGLITYLPYDENYEAKWALLKMCSIFKKKKGYGDFGTCLYDSMIKNRELAAQIEEYAAAKPEEAAALFERVLDFDKKRRKAGISIYSFRKMSPKCNAFCKGLNALVGLPYFILSAILSLPTWAISMKIRKNAKDPAFHNTASLGVRLVLGPVLFIIYAALAFCLGPWWLAVIILAAYLTSLNYFHDYIEGCRRWFSDIRLLKNKKLYKEFKSIVKDFLA